MIIENTTRFRKRGSEAPDSIIGKGISIPQSRFGDRSYGV